MLVHTLATDDKIFLIYKAIFYYKTQATESDHRRYRSRMRNFTYMEKKTPKFIFYVLIMYF